MPKPKTIAQYIEAAPEQARGKLREMYAIIRRSAPDAVEGLKWGLPAFSGHRILVTFAGFKHHVGFYPTPSVVQAFAKEITRFKTGNGSVQFPLDKPLPKGLIAKMTKLRVKECNEEDKKWRSNARRPGKKTASLRVRSKS